MNCYGLILESPLYRLINKYRELQHNLVIKIKYPKKNINDLYSFFQRKKLNYLIKLSKAKDPLVNEMTFSNPLKPDLEDLYNLYHYVVLNKRINILEFGSGFSTLIFFIALNDLKHKYLNQVTNLRRNNAFELFVLESNKKYLKITKQRIFNYIKINKLTNIAKVNFFCSDVEMTKFNNNIVSEYNQLPLCNPDFVYLDGPDQFRVKKSINGISTRHKDFMPMASDILKIEYFLTPGTIILVDGRSANAQFLKDNFKRKWIYKNDKKNDQHIFLLKAPILGKFNQKQISFYNKI